MTSRDAQKRVATAIAASYRAGLLRLERDGVIYIDQEPIRTALEQIAESRIMAAAEKWYLRVLTMKGSVPEEVRSAWRIKLDEYFRTILNSRIYLIGNTSRRELFRILNEANNEGLDAIGITRRIKESAIPRAKDRAKVIARTELTSSQNYGAFMGARSAGATHKKWLTMEDARVRPGETQGPFSHVHANGQVARIDEPFVVSGEQMMYPGHARDMGGTVGGGSAGNVIGCRCSMTFEVR